MKPKSIYFQFIYFNVKKNNQTTHNQTQPWSLFSTESNKYSVWDGILFFSEIQQWFIQLQESIRLLLFTEKQNKRL